MDAGRRGCAVRARTHPLVKRRSFFPSDAFLVFDDARATLLPVLRFFFYILPAVRKSLTSDVTDRHRARYSELILTGRGDGDGDDDDDDGVRVDGRTGSRDNRMRVPRF